MIMLKSIMKGFCYQLGKYFFLLLFGFIVYFILKGVDFNWRDILNSLYYL